jgi:ankyrin repeat protein
MFNKKAKSKQETTIVPHRNLNVLLQRAKTGDSARAVQAYLDAGGSPDAVVEYIEATNMLQLLLLHTMVFLNAHPNRELADSVQLLVDAGADINCRVLIHGERQTALSCAVRVVCCTAVAHALLQAGADPCVRSTPSGLTTLHVAAFTKGGAAASDSCEVLLARADTPRLLEIKDAGGMTVLMRAVQDGRVEVVQLL